MVNKKAQDLSIGTLILIVLGIIVLVLLILGFSMGWGNLWEKINIFGGGGSSIESEISACNLAVTSNSKYSYCENFQKIKIDGKTEYLNCQDGRVEPNLNSKLTCDKTTAQYIEAKCDSLSAADRTKVKVNNADCPATSSTQCAGVGTQVVKANEATCLAATSGSDSVKGKVVPGTFSDVKDPQVCCKF